VHIQAPSKKYHTLKLPDYINLYQTLASTSRQSAGDSQSLGNGHQQQTVHFAHSDEPERDPFASTHSGDFASPTAPTARPRTHLRSPVRSHARLGVQHRSSPRNMARDTRLYPCSHCGNHFSSQNTLKRHLKEICERSEELRCPHDECGAAFAHPYKLHEHDKTGHHQLPGAVCNEAAGTQRVAVATDSIGETGPGHAVGLTDQPVAGTPRTPCTSSAQVSSTFQHLSPVSFPRERAKTRAFGAGAVSPQTPLPDSTVVRSDFQPQSPRPYLKAQVMRAQTPTPWVMPPPPNSFQVPRSGSFPSTSGAATGVVFRSNDGFAEPEGAFPSMPSQSPSFAYATLRILHRTLPQTRHPLRDAIGHRITITPGRIQASQTSPSRLDRRWADNQTQGRQHTRHHGMKSCGAEVRTFFLESEKPSSSKMVVS
jgi:hypothetical protein